MYLAKPSIEQAKLQGLMEGLAAAGGDVDGMSYLQHLASIRSMSMGGMTQAASPSGPDGGSGAGLMSSLGKLASKAASGSVEGVFAAGMKGLKTIVASDKETPVCQIMDELMEQKPTEKTEKYLYLDPKVDPRSGEAPRIRAPFRRGIAFVIGGGNYPEHQSLQEWGQKHGRQICYGSTDMVAPIQ